MDYQNIQRMEKLSTLINNIADGAWLESLTEEQNKVLKSWIKAMRLGSDERPNLIVTLKLTQNESILPVILFNCGPEVLEDGGEEEAQTEISVPGYVDWIDLDEEFPDHYKETPILDLSTISAIVEYKKRTDG